MKQEKKKWSEMNPKEKKEALKGFLIIIVLLIILFYALKGCIYSDNDYYDYPEQEAIEYPKLSNSYYDSIYAFKAFPAIDQDNPPRIDLKGNLKKATIMIRLKKRLNEEELKSIGIYYHDKYLAHPFNRVYVFYYTPEYTKEDAGCYATTHSDPELKVNIIDAAKYWND